MEEGELRSRLPQRGWFDFGFGQAKQRVPRASSRRDRVTGASFRTLTFTLVIGAYPRRPDTAFQTGQVLLFALISALRAHSQIPNHVAVTCTTQAHATWYLSPDQPSGRMEPA